MRHRLRDAQESTTSGKTSLWWTSGAPAPDFSSGAPAVGSSGRFPFLARPSQGRALRHHGTTSPFREHFPGTSRRTSRTASDGNSLASALLTRHVTAAEPRLDPRQLGAQLRDFAPKLLSASLQIAPLRRR